MKHNVTVRFEWKLRDFWVGGYWKRGRLQTDVWICLLPCLPIHIIFWRVECPQCGALVKKLSKEEPTGHEFCCIHCAWNPDGCRCRYGELGLPEKNLPL